MFGNSRYYEVIKRYFRRSDTDAIASDWKAVGDCIRSVVSAIDVALQDDEIEKYFPIEVSIDPDSGNYFLSHPDLPGCWADGETLEEALDSLRDAREIWLDTLKERLKERRK